MPITGFLGPAPAKVALAAERLERVDCGRYTREKVRYSVGENERVSAYVCIPHDLAGPAPVVFCHHQHASRFDLGKSEVVGLAGDPDQAYAAELAERGFVTIAPDAIGFEERNWSPDGKSNVSWFELSTRLVHGRTLLASCLHDVSTALDYVTSRPEADPRRIGFLGHSYGGRMALWAPAYDPRIIASVSNCGCIPFRRSYSHDTGLQAEFVLPGFAVEHDLEDVIASYDGTALLISAGATDKWSRGAEELVAASRGVELAMYDAGHVFTAAMRERAYQFLGERLADF
ncbi:dienelactone hydrolase family protein [Actinoplanes sp. Pm04-4]|uniref:Dienelactone hydrolase family protein n=1 Tax=Paractinoplanes pyxinae TaxID=2997416 RepID=A0ABT4B0E1_9ACTN|nr:dienelactone hydrolase family protein [Actinoplanes pyxinae]MCY1139940.1 dienelactone hydrolase family protein [Actinoplanes pyxinae]